MSKRLSHGEMLQLRRWNTPTIFNGWEQITSRDHVRECFNLDEVRDFMPHAGVMVGRAVTVVIEPSNRAHPKNNPDAPGTYDRYLASVPGPKIVIVQDLDRPRVYGSFWGEVSSNLARALGCVGTIVDGGVRDLDEMAYAGFKVLARRLCVGHAEVWPVRWNCEVEVFGCTVRPGQLIHADKHGFMAIPEEDEERLLDAATFLDQLECQTMIASARESAGRTSEEVLAAVKEAGAAYGAASAGKFRRGGEWG